MRSVTAGERQSWRSDGACATAPGLFFGTITPKVSGAVNTTIAIGGASSPRPRDFRKGNKIFDGDLDPIRRLLRRMSTAT